MARPKEFDRDRVLDKAMQLFWCRGYEATTMQDLVEALGVNRQSIYDTFGDKHSLFQAALNRYVELQTSQIQTTLAQPGMARPAIRQVFEATIAVLTEQQPSRGCLLVNTTIELAPHDQAIAEIVSNSMNRTEKAFYQILERAQANGELGEKPRNLAALARFLNNSLQGLAVTAKANVGKVALQDAAEVTLAMLD